MIAQAERMFGHSRDPLISVEAWISRIKSHHDLKNEKVSQSGFHLLLTTMRFDHRRRLTADEAIEHPFFKGIKFSD